MAVADQAELVLAHERLGVEEVERSATSATRMLPLTTLPRPHTFLSPRGAKESGATTT